MSSRQKESPIKTMYVKIEDVDALPLTKKLIFDLAEKLSKTFSSVGVIEDPKNTADNIIAINGRREVIEGLEQIFSEITFKEDMIVSVRDISVSKAKYYLNLVAAYVSGRNSIAGPLSFISRLNTFSSASESKDEGIETDVEIRRGAVDLAKVRGSIEGISFVATVLEKGKVSVKRNSLSIIPMFNVTQQMISQEA